MRAHYLQHVSFEGLGSIEAWLQNSSYDITSTQFHESAELPCVEDIDLLVVMGGPMSIYDENDYPWLIAEKKFIKKFIKSGKPTLGVCLGAQLIADSMGGKVFPNALKEIGWFPVQAVPSSHAIFKFPDEIDVFHWHGETFSLPVRAVRIVESKACKNQAFQIGSSVIGLQFHLETTLNSVQSILANCRDELLEGKYIQAEEEILYVSQERYESINALMCHILEYLHQCNK